MGQLTNQAAIDLERSGLGRMRCAVGVAAGIEGLVEGAAKAPHVIVLDGCPTGCAAQGLRRATGREPDTQVVVTELGVAKAHDFDISRDVVRTVVAAARRAMGLNGEE